MARRRAETQGRRRRAFSARTLEGACGIIALESERCCRQAEDREEWQRTMARRWLVACRQVQQATEHANLANWVQHNLGLDGPALLGEVITVAEDVRAASGSPGPGGALLGGSPDKLSPDEEEEGPSQGLPARQRTPRQSQANASLDTGGVDSELACPWRQVPGRREREDASCVGPGVDAVSRAVGKWGDGVAHPVAEPLSRGVKGTPHARMTARRRMPRCSSLGKSGRRRRRRRWCGLVKAKRGVEKQQGRGGNQEKKQEEPTKSTSPGSTRRVQSVVQVTERTAKRPLL